MNAHVERVLTALEGRAQRPHVFTLGSFDDRTQSVFCRVCQQRTQDIAGPCPGRERNDLAS